MGLTRLRMSSAWNTIKMVILIACVSAGVLVMIFFGFPLIEDLIKDVDPSLRYQPKVEKDFELQPDAQMMKEPQSEEMFLTYKLKNDPYIDGNQIIFTTHANSSDVYQLDAVAIYDVTNKEVDLLPDITMKYDHLMAPKLSDDYAVWIDSDSNGGGRIVGYDRARKKQFLIKEYVYAIPSLSLEGELLAFMQWAGDKVQRLYLFNMRTREAVTVKLYEETSTGNSAADLSASDLVWSEYRVDKSGQIQGALKRVVFEGELSKFENYDMKMDVFEPKTNGKDIVFATKRNILDGELMLSRMGGEPFKIADNVLNYDIGDGFVAYTKDDQVFVLYIDQQRTDQLTNDIAKNILMSVNENGITYYDITDGVLPDEVVKYTIMS